MEPVGSGKPSSPRPEAQKHNSQLRALLALGRSAASILEWSPVALSSSMRPRMTARARVACAWAVMSSTVGRVRDDCAEGADEAAEIPRALLGELGAAGIEELTATVGEGDERVAGPELVDKHAGAGLEGVRELSQGDLTAFGGRPAVRRLG
jgi:hypothetical protein